MENSHAPITFSRSSIQIKGIDVIMEIYRIDIKQLSNCRNLYSNKSLSKVIYGKGFKKRGITIMQPQVDNLHLPRDRKNSHVFIHYN